MTTLYRHIHDLSPEAWAALTKRVTADVLSAADRHGTHPPQQLLAVGSMSESDLIENRRRSGPHKNIRPSIRQRLLESDHLRAVAEQQTRVARQNERDAQTAAANASAEAADSVRAARDAREQRRAIVAESARKDAEHSGQRRADRVVIEELRTALERAQNDAVSASAQAGDLGRAAQEARERTAAVVAESARKDAEHAERRRASEVVIEELRAALEEAQNDAVSASALAGDLGRAAQEARERTAAVVAESARKDAEHAERRRASEVVIEELRAALEEAQNDAVSASALAGDLGRAAQEARERTAAVVAESARKDAEHAERRRANEVVIEELRAALERAQNDAVSASALAGDLGRAVHEGRESGAAAMVAESARKDAEHAEQRRADRLAIEELRAALEKVRTDAAAEVDAAREQARGALARAEQRSAERISERHTGQATIEALRGELERLRADSTAHVEEARRQAAAEIAAVRETAANDIAQVRGEAQAYANDAMDAVNRAEAEADRARRHAQAADARGAKAEQLLAVPLPAFEVRSRTGRIENALIALHQIDYLLEVGTFEGAAQTDVETLRSLVSGVQVQAGELQAEMSALPGWFTEPDQQGAASDYVLAAARAYGGFLRRIQAGADRLRTGMYGQDEEIIGAVTRMLNDPQVHQISAAGWSAVRESV